MGRPKGPPRPIVATRITGPGLEILQRWAVEDGVSLSEVMRRLLREAMNQRLRREGVERGGNDK